ncbi:hypothetical protein N7456_007925 [Penicillium angulare]|uniref:Spindle pole body component n=1 Tax=Penicillium angulare TaxID=116970 RepID=A0A9W9FBV4_9EURO|nr:hypothetical protein N7456_007925 [Penicillium angulare]
MELGEYEPNPFSSESFWRLSRFSIEALQPLDDLPWNASLSEIPESLFATSLDPIDKIDPIWKLNFLNDIEPPESSVNSSIEPSIDARSSAPTDETQELDIENNIWAPELLRKDPGFVAPLKSWEKFQDKSFQEPVSAYFSESGAKGFDAALAGNSHENSQESTCRLIREDFFVRCLLRLGLGWSSPLFRYNPQTTKFENSLTTLRVSGVSQSVTDTILDNVVRCGTNMQYARTFARNVQSKSKDVSSVFTLRSTIAVIVSNLERQIFGRSAGIVSMLQATTLFHRCGDLIEALVDIVKATENTTSDAETISTVVNHAAFLAQKFGWMENLVQEIVVRVTEPWLEFIEGWVGLRPEAPALKDLVTNGNTFIQVEQYDGPVKFRTGPPRIEYSFRGDQMPSFIPDDQAQLIFESGKSLRLLKKSHPHHPIARHDVLLRSGHLHLTCATTWKEIEQIQRKAQEYEANLRAEILRYHKLGSSTVPTDLEPHNDTEPDGNQLVQNTFELFDIDDENRVSGSAVDGKPLFEDKVSGMLQKAEGEIGFSEAGSRFGPELASELYLSFAPVITCQAKLVDFSCLHHLFKEHRLRHHLNIQWRFQLLGDGSFASHLSHSLFDPEMESGERKSGVVRSGVYTGLRLGSRDNWPPASSELRLVLMGLLGDCYFSERDPEASDTAQSQRENELPGGLSFSIRELTGEEIERCRDPNAIEALDFLRLQYKPPSSLEALITTRSLGKYDRLFKHLLRLLRMVSAVKGLIRDSTVRGTLSGDIRNSFQKFRIDAQHFVLAISDYCFQVGIGSIWNRFQRTLDRIERCLNRGDIDGTIEAAHSVPRLRDLHEDILDQMLFAFFLSKRHAAAAKLLDNIFSTILAFAPISRADGNSGLRHQNEGRVLHLYSTFRKQVSAFVGYLRGLESGKGASKSMIKSGEFFGLRTDPTSVFEHLRVRLEMKEYY